MLDQFVKDKDLKHDNEWQKKVRIELEKAANKIDVLQDESMFMPLIKLYTANCCYSKIKEYMTTGQYECI